MTTGPDEAPGEAGGWLARCAALLDQEELTPAERDRVLDLTRVVAHGTQRRFAPLTAYLLGAAAADQSGGAGREQASAELARRLLEVLPDDENG